MLFRQAAGFSCKKLQQSLTEILWAEYRIKGSALDTRLIMDNLLLNLLRQNQWEALRA
jgi:DNA polymerase III delta subunit